tara:strand:+ start:219 stop:806 length:588 start_codon:yes stop_codon:yes gene_type:complete
MIFNNLHKLFFKFAFLGSLVLFTNQCGIWDPADARKVPVNAKDRVAKNIEEGRAIKFSKLGKGGGTGNFEFASSNEMWRATIEILDFVPLSSADYGGGIVITDWYNDVGNEKEAIKIMVQFLSNEIRADGIKVVVYDKYCETINNCRTNINQGNVSEEIKLAILKKASIYKNIETEKKRKEYRKKNPTKNKKIRN